MLLPTEVAIPAGLMPLGKIKSCIKWLHVCLTWRNPPFRLLPLSPCLLSTASMLPLVSMCMVLPGILGKLSPRTNVPLLLSMLITGV